MDEIIEFRLSRLEERINEAQVKIDLALEVLNTLTKALNQNEEAKNARTL